MMKVKISVEDKYFEEISHLVTGAFGEGDDSVKRPFREIVGTFTGETVRTVIKHSDKFVILKAEVDGNLAGTVTVRVRTSEYFIMYLVVSERFRGGGVARELMEHIFDRFPGRTIRISCSNDLKVVYSKFGFREISKTLSGTLIMERGYETIIPKGSGELPNTERLLNKASLASLDLDFYPETHFHGRYNTIHAVDKYKIIKPLDKYLGAGVGIIQPGAMTYYTAGNSISQNLIPPHLDEGGYKYDIMTRVLVSASGTFWIQEDTFKRRCLEKFDKEHISFSNTSRLSSWSRLEAVGKLSEDLLHIIQTLFTKVYDKLFGYDYSNHQIISLIMMYDEDEKLWLLECNV